LKKISVIIPCRNEEKYIADCLDSVINNDYPKDYMTVILIDGMSTDTTQSIIQSYVKKYNYIHYILNEKRTVPCALNLGIKKSKGDYIIILGAHSEIPKNYFSRLMNWNIKLDADNVGAICITEVRNKNPKTNLEWEIPFSELV
jgi:glycosyltransferase involved in cell wall biosynthesis